MVEETEPPEPITATKRRSWLRWIFGGVFLLLVILLAIAYWQRISIAERFAQAQIEKYDVRASYNIKDIGLRTQRLENVVLGDPANPDFTAELIELDMSLNFTGATLRDVRAKGVRLRGRYADGKLSFGELDKFTDPESKEPFEIPDIGAVLSDAQLRLETPWGVIGVGLDGAGLLRQRFEGNLALRVPALRYGDCRADAVRFDGRYILDFRQPNLIGPWLADNVACKKAGFAASQPKIDGELRLSDKFDHWFGNVNYSAKSLDSGNLALNRARGRLEFDGNKDRTNFDAKLEGGSYQSAPLDIRNLIASAKGHLDISDGGVSVAARGDADLVGGRLAKSYVAGVDAIAANARETPVGPLLARMVPAIRSAVADFDGRLRYDASIGAGGQSVILVDGIDLLTRSGARASQSGLAQLRDTGSGWHLTSPMRLSLSGGNLPAMRLALTGGSAGQWSGDIALDRYAAGGASLSVPKLAFAGRAGGAWTFDGRAQMTGPLPQGYVTGLNLPLNGRWDGRNVSLYQSCQTVAFDSLKYTSLSLSRQSMRVCPQGGSILQTGTRTQINATLPSFAMDGSYAGSRLKLRSGNVRFDLDKGFVADGVNAEWGSAPIRVDAPILRFTFADGFNSENVRVETGTAEALTFFDIAAINGAFDKEGLRGKMSGAEGQIANVPMIMSEAAGDWSLVGGDLKLEAALLVSDSAQVDRFKTVTIPNALVTLENGVINALATIYEPTKGRMVGEADVRHTLASGVGRALFSIDDLRFDEKFQPELLTPLVLGVIANTYGALSGTGRVDWNEDAVTSGGTFETKRLNFAAAFGPVENLSTTLVFNDLLNFETGPGQVALLGSVNPGIPANNGQIRYRLLPGKKIGIEGGKWPFAGGELILEPTIIDFAVEAERRLTFRVVGMDAAEFLQQYDFDNLQISGKFDGILPMVFNQEGGRIVGGSLVSRAGGGELSYLGELSYEDMGTFANFAFNALKSIRYSELEIGVAGNIDGEMVTQVRFSGLQQGTGAKRNFITKQLAKIPIQFNVTIRAQFLQLMGSIRTLYDPEYARDRFSPILLDQQRGVPPVTGEEEPAASAEKGEDSK